MSGAAIDGAWDCTTDTPMGTQRFTMQVTRAGDRFTALASGALGSMAIEDGRIDGDRLSWTMEIKTPMSMRLTGKADVAGDRIEGGISAGFLGTFPFSGVRAGG